MTSITPDQKLEVPWLDLKAQQRAVRDEILPMWEEILDSAGFIGGPHVAGLEAEFAAACKTEHCVALNSGTDALRFILMALDLKPGDEVITVPNTFIATTEAISQAGGKVVFVDIDPESYNLDPAKLEAAITPKTRAIMPVHLYGQPADLDPILAIASKHGIPVVEDSAQAHLAQYKGRMAGSIGIAAGFSFYPGKNLGACGEAGAVTTNDAKIAQTIRTIRDHGQSKKYYHEREGYNGRCDAMQAAALRVKLRKLPEWNEARRRNAARYAERLAGASGVKLPKTTEGCLPVHHLFVVLVENRDAVAEQLKVNGVATGLHYPLPLHQQDAYRWMNLPKGSFPVTEHCAGRLLTLPMFPELTEQQIDYVSDQLTRATS